MTPPVPSPAAPEAAEKLVRLVDQRLVAGVAAGIAGHLRVRVAVVRAVFVLLAFMAGSGVVAYALLWMFVPQAASAESESPAARRSTAVERRRATGIAAIGVGAAIGALALGAGQWVGALLGPLVIIAIGAAFLWREADDAQRQRWRRTTTGWVQPRRRSWWRIVSGVALVIGGLGVFAIAQVDVASARSAAVAVVLTLVGVAVIAIPYLTKLMRDLTDERRERIREAERAEVAAHLHDSVLQTLALIQRQPDDPRQVQRLARAQERDLRAWLYGPGGYARGEPPGEFAAAPTTAAGVALPASVPGGLPTATARQPASATHRVVTYQQEGAQSEPVPAAIPTTSAAAVPATSADTLRRAAAQVEDSYAVAVSPVIVGDLPVTDAMEALIAAAREAMTNAAKHAEVDEISVYAEFAADRAAIYVRDRGVGFDPAAIPADRRGVAESIRGRMERYGGRARVRSTPGSGTEWELAIDSERRQR